MELLGCQVSVQLILYRTLKANTWFRWEIGCLVRRELVRSALP
jgi:hypothetical protein